MERTLAPGDTARSASKPRGKPTRWQGRSNRSGSQGREWVCVRQGQLHWAKITTPKNSRGYIPLLPGLASEILVILNGLAPVGRRSE